MRGRRHLAPRCVLRVWGSRGSRRGRAQWTVSRGLSKGVYRRVDAQLRSHGLRQGLQRRGLRSARGGGCLYLAVSSSSFESLIEPGGRLTIKHIPCAIPWRHLSEIEAFAIAIACSYNHEPAASNATRERVDHAKAGPRPF